MTGRYARGPAQPSRVQDPGAQAALGLWPSGQAQPHVGGECKGGCRHSACAHLYTCCGMQHFCPLVCMGYSACLGLGSLPLLIKEDFFLGPLWG